MVLDTTVLVYAVGAEHRFRTPTRRLVEAISAGRVRAKMDELKERFPEGLEEEIAQAVTRLEQDAGQQFGGGSDPLLLSVRSGFKWPEKASGNPM